MKPSSQNLFWRRLDAAGLERLELTIAENRIVANSTTIGVEDGGFRIEHRWVLTPDWSVQSCIVRKEGVRGRARLALERYGNGWKVDGDVRPDLEGTGEPDLSITPFCNSFPIRHMIAADQDHLTLDTSFIDAAAMRVSRSRQSYRRVGPDLFHYLDLGFADGFEAHISVDHMGLVIRYDGLFERVEVQ
ncbi:hypothetical protein GCM10007989_27030 [Devosia pacifica]|uniref:Glycolipid-binding domain-containing protein n=1 Tax=Devosia pacifica TaxID=1335967 RepID=A0A918VWG4_9HYPH|nr:putative glycolipid-binding domain-containing protein [Devosia pacifica]GHA29953.1 hypothetical protein GCM10007989_27030 [Devosia pacifica]